MMNRLLSGFRRFTPPSKRISLYEQAIAACACLISILLTTGLSQAYAGHQPVLFASMGASAVILFAMPGSPLAQPWPFIGGHICSGLIGMAAARYIPDLAMAAACAAGLAVILMMRLQCLHPPGAATALVPVLNGFGPAAPDFHGLLLSLGLNLAIMMCLAIAINKLVLRRDYPAKNIAKPPSPSQANAEGSLTGINRHDIDLATSGINQFLDIGENDLYEILARLQRIEVEKNLGLTTCADIMQGEIHTVEYDSNIAEAWALMHERHLKVLPVLDKTRRVIGIVTRYDFLKNLKLTHYQNFQDKWLSFLKPSPDISTNKPESVGHIMTRKVKTLPADAHIAELIPLVINEGHHHIPVVDEKGRFVGMVFQSRLLSALYKKLALPAGNR